MSASGEVVSLDSGPLEKSHMRDMIQRNAIHDMAYGRFTKRLESQKKAFVRQNTRDEEEMKTLLCRLQTEQQLPIFEDEDFDSDDDDEDTLSDGDGTLDDMSVSDTQAVGTANPYPVTIIPKYSSNTPRRTNSKKSIDIPDLSKYSTKGKSDNLDDVQESMSALSMSPPGGSYSNSQSGSMTNLSRDETIGDWLASPDAISSIRRARKTVSEQANKKNLIRTNSEYISQQDLANAYNLQQSPRGNVRCNSLKDRRKSSMSKESLIGCRRGSSLKEKKTDVNGNSDIRKTPLSRSVSLLTRTSLAEFNMRQELKSRKQSLGSSNDSIGHNDKKQCLSRKSSNETENDGKKSSTRSGSFKAKNSSTSKTMAPTNGK